MALNPLETMILNPECILESPRGVFTYSKCLSLTPGVKECVQAPLFEKIPRGFWWTVKIENFCFRDMAYRMSSKLIWWVLRELALPVGMMGKGFDKAATLPNLSPQFMVEAQSKQLFIIWEGWETPN